MAIRKSSAKPKAQTGAFVHADANEALVDRPEVVKGMARATGRCTVVAPIPTLCLPAPKQPSCSRSAKRSFRAPRRGTV
ncbi:MAG: hypothetical protein IT503_20540 [Burkholderiaceae bacterium]|nr:MAG: hypothetical protein F9K36_16995 [Burkholderiaceae bacterium]MBE7424974.1 hypothetical protein [Ideonella sp.]MCC7288570.1 hypothetical protein [Burkholderiaceae bacterium]